ncbi:porin family protein [Nitrosomonas communis]|uniref:porin family protein n=1 Tax=Nitrosomonas communis TaxID=44574 RepID=UPI0026F1BEBF|nr:porin family protein [Nitrosomonas communis]MCO6427743.1 porin family protein [Nitrosomonas communis]
MRLLRHRMRLVVRAVASALAITMTITSLQASAHDTSTRALERQIQLLESQLKAIREELNQVKEKTIQEEQEIRRVNEEIRQEKEFIRKEHVKQHEEMNQVHEHHHEMERVMARRDRLLFFRGGFAHNLQERNGVTLQSNVAPVGAQETGDDNGWYIGAGFDWNLTRDVWGLMPKTGVYAELMFEYKKFGSSQGNALANAPTQLAGGTLNPRSVTVSQFTVSAAPKIKFMEGSDFRPWIIPAGFSMHVISPPSESITVLAPGMMFAAGADYRIWKEFYLGVDARYHETFGKTDGVNMSGMTAGAYLGIGF